MAPIQGMSLDFGALSPLRAPGACLGRYAFPVLLVLSFPAGTCGLPSASAPWQLKLWFCHVFSPDAQGSCCGVIVIVARAGHGRDVLQ